MGAGFVSRPGELLARDSYYSLGLSGDEEMPSFISKVV
jgi:hypothetical protein